MGLVRRLGQGQDLQPLAPNEPTTTPSVPTHAMILDNRISTEYQALTYSGNSAVVMYSRHFANNRHSREAQYGF